MYNFLNFGVAPTSEIRMPSNLALLTTRTRKYEGMIIPNGLTFTYNFNKIRQLI
jgi:hypothetical protein